MKVALYTRCSSDMQENLDRSIPAQLKALRDYCDKKEYLVYKEYVEPGETAYGDDENREQFTAMIEDAKKHNFDLVLVHKFNRFYRNQFKSMFFKKTLKDYGVKVISISEELNPDTTHGFLTERIIETLDQVSSMQTAWETMKGMKENAEQGFKNGGVVPYGYKRVQIAIDVNRPIPRYKIKWEIDEEKAKTVRKIFELRCEGKSLKKICDYLNFSMIPSPRGDYWGISTVRYFFQRADVYAGDYWWNIYDKKTKGKKYNDKEDWVIVKDIHPAIIDRQTAEKAKMPIGKSNNKKFIPSKISRYILTGKNINGEPLFICKRCGGNYIGHKMKNNQKKEYHKYICSRYHKIGKMACGDPLYLPKDYIEEIVINEICKRYDNLKGIDRIVAKLYKDKEHIDTEIKNRLRFIDNEIRKVNQKIEQLAQSIYDGVNNSILVPLSNKLAKELEDLKDRRKHCLEEEKFKDNIDVNKVVEIFKDFRNIIKNGDYEEKHNAIISFLKQIVVDPDNKKVFLDFYELPSELLVTTKSGARDRVYRKVVTF